jgi:predicted metal-dependent hydrolase
MVNKKHFNGKIQWNAIRWVRNMQSRLGSCTRGGPTDGQIRISDKIKDWPEWVVDYVIAHELLHRKLPNHSAIFWNELRAAYPLTEQARGFIQGVSFASGRTFEDDPVDEAAPSAAGTDGWDGCDGI